NAGRARSLNQRHAKTAGPGNATGVSAMASFDTEMLPELRDAREVAIRTDKHPKTGVAIWVVVADGEVFVRSVYGTRGRWYRDLAAGGTAMLEIAGRRLAVQALPESDPGAVDR